MVFVEDKAVRVINDEKVRKTEVKYIFFGDENTANKKAGVNNTLNGYNKSLYDILFNIKGMLAGELDGAKLISELEPNTQLCIKNLDLNEDLYGQYYGVDNPVITITEEQIKQANYTVKQYEYLLRLFNILQVGAYRVETRELRKLE